MNHEPEKENAGTLCPQDREDALLLALSFDWKTELARRILFDTPEELTAGAWLAMEEEKAEKLFAELFADKEKEAAAKTCLRRARRQRHREGEIQNTAREKTLLSQGIRAVFYGDAEYPEKLRTLSEPPCVLFVKGDLPREDVPAVSIIGARMAGAYGREQARRFGSVLSENGVQVISGMARGIDGIAGQAALSGPGGSFAVLGCGVDVCYPEENASLYRELTGRAGCGVFSEYHPKALPRPFCFVQRNRLISALADILLVVEAREKSGTMTTVAAALEQGREVYAVPGRISDRTSDGCNRLLFDGAGVALSPEILLEALVGKGGGKKVPVREKKKTRRKKREETALPEALSETEKAVLSRLSDLDGTDAETVFARLREEEAAVSIAELHSALTLLLIKGRITEEDGRRYRRRL